MVPEGMAYAGIVGVPAIMGLYTVVPPLIAYALFGSSRLLVVGPDTATGLISALTVGAIAAQGTSDFNTLTSTLAVLIGAFFLLFGALRMGWMAAFIPTPVMRGFIEGLVCVTIIGQVPHLAGHRRHIRQLLRQFVVRAAASIRRPAGPGADRLAQPLGNVVAAPPGPPHSLRLWWSCSSPRSSWACLAVKAPA
jgi:MFS superfamily sulfate permease-like transporter